MIAVGVHVYILYVCIGMYICDKNKFEWQFSGRLTFSNTPCRLIYRLAMVAELGRNVKVRISA